MGLYRKFGKQFIDYILAFSALIILLPLMIIIALLVRLKLGTPILFRQKRPGLGGQLFSIYKFRSMSDVQDAEECLLSDGERLTTFGRVLRSTSLDEFPELINVLRGEMSLVGPRPLLVQYLKRYTPEQMRRHEVKPGITGWAQVKGRNAISWEQRFKLDVWYVDHVSLWLDLKIIMLTLWKIVKREGINEPGQATIGEFMGSREA
jgi:lipopolysaccharide/colanic/teichoic acid biosynthesis glycosyltransferase